jgi:hypothetical protein
MSEQKLVQNVVHVCANCRPFRVAFCAIPASVVMKVFSRGAHSCLHQRGCALYGIIHPPSPPSSPFSSIAEGSKASFRATPPASATSFSSFSASLAFLSTPKTVLASKQAPDYQSKFDKPTSVRAFVHKYGCVCACVCVCVCERERVCVFVCERECVSCANQYTYAFIFTCMYGVYAAWPLPSRT